MNQILLYAAHFSAAFAATAIVMGAGAALGIDWCRGVFRAGDYLVAAVFGGDGQHSVSAYCGAIAKLSALKRLIDLLFGKGHCEKAALDEGLTSEPSA